MSGSLLRALIGGLLIGGIVHVVTILSIPGAAENDPVDRIHRAAAARSMSMIPADGSVLPDLDPFFVHAACPFDLVNGPVQVAGVMPDEVWTMVVVSETGGVVGSLDRASTTAGQLDLVVGGTAAIERMRLDVAGSGRAVTFVTAPIGRGFVLLRAFAGENREEIAEALSAVECGSV